MPVKIRCRGCEKILNAPDAARGKVIQCPKCGTKLKVPAGQQAGSKKPAAAQSTAGSKPGKASVKKQRRQPVKAAAPPPSETDFFANLDFQQAEDTESRVCPYCATDLDEESDVCPGCGMNVATAQMDPKEKIRRSRKGPDTRKFYKEAWTDSWAFVKKRKDLALRTGWYLTVFIVLSFASVFMVTYCTSGPPKTFWAACSFMAMMGLPGWSFFLSMKIVEFSMGKQEKMDRIHFDFFQCVTLGMRTIFWPAVMLIPFIPIIVAIKPAVVLLPLIPAMSLFTEVDPPAWAEYRTVFILLGILSAVPLLVLPLAIVHMTAKYTYKAWILWELSKVFIKNIGPALYWVSMATLTFLLPFGAVLGGIQLFGGGVNPFFNEHYLSLTEKMVAPLLGTNAGWQFTAVAAVVRFSLAFVLAAPLFMLAGFPIVFLMRAIGVLGYYRKHDLELVPMVASNTPCGFWVRMLAFLVDVLFFPLAIFVAVKDKRAMSVGLLLSALVGVTLLFGYLRTSVAPFAIALWAVYMWWMYFCVQESTTQRTTIGKDGFGLIVATEDNKQMTLGMATKRFFASLLTLLTMFLGFVMCAVHPQKKALHDIVSKTKVVWEGDK